MTQMNLHWKFKPFASLELEELYAILKARQEVFNMEQEIHYTDPDDRDQDAWHLFAQDEEGEIVAYLRLRPPGKMTMHSAGLVQPAARQPGVFERRLHPCFDAGQLPRQDRGVPVFGQFTV